MSSSDIKVVVDYSDLTGLIKTSKQTEQSLSLVARSFAKTKDQKSYMTGINQIVRAQKNLDAKSRMSRKEIMKLGASMRQEAVFAEQLAVATAKASTHINAMGKSSNRAGVAMQQTGYQVGDFLVQVQSGTNPMVAFGQQATQLVGVLYLLPQATLAAKVGILGLRVSVAALVATAGILIPLLTALGAYMMRAKEDAEGSSGGIEGAFSELPSFFSSLGISIGESFDEAFSKIESSYGQMFERLAKIKLQQTKDSLAQAFADEVANSDNVSIFARIAETFRPHQTNEMKAANSQELNKTELAIKAIGASYFEAVQSATSMSQIISITKDTEEQLALVSEKAANAFTLQTEALGVVSAAIEEINDKQKTGYNRFDQHLKAYQKYKDKIDQANSDTEESIRLERQKLGLLSVEQEEGKETARYRKLSYTFERDNLKIKLRAAGVSEGLIATRVAQLAVEQKITAEIERQKEVTYNLMEGSAAAIALRKYGGRSTTDDRDPTQDGESIYSKEPKDSRKTGQEIVQNLLKQASHKAKLVDLNEEEARYAQLLYTMQENNAKAKQPLDQKELEMFAMKIQAIKEETREREKQKKVVEDLAKTIGNAMSNSLMSIVDGTQSVKEAFKSMASDIIKHLYKVLVVQQMVNAFGGFLSGSSNASVSKIGNALQSYDGGGYTGSGSRSGGLDGKGGFMAMLHPKETVVDHSKGQSGGVTVVQNINISTGVQQTVRAEIRQMMPQIAQSAKAAVVDSKRRGGNYGRAMA